MRDGIYSGRGVFLYVVLTMVSLHQNTPPLTRCLGESVFNSCQGNSNDTLTKTVGREGVLVLGYHCPKKIGKLWVYRDNE